MSKQMKLIAAALFMVMGLALPAMAVYRINSGEFLPPQGVINAHTITVADRVLASAPVHDLGAAMRAWVTFKVKMKNVSGTVASVVFTANSCTAATCAAGAVSQVINTGYLTLASGVYLLQGFIDDPMEFVQLTVTTTGAPAILFDTELAWVRLQ